MKLDPADLADLRPLLDEVIVATLDRLRADAEKLDGKRLGYPEAEAAVLLGVNRHVLRDARLRQEIHARKIGKRYIYSRDSLLKFLRDDGQR